SGQGSGAGSWTASKGGCGRDETASSGSSYRGEEPAGGRRAATRPPEASPAPPLDHALPYPGAPASRASVWPASTGGPALGRPGTSAPASMHTSRKPVAIRNVSVNPVTVGCPAGV